MALTWNKIRNYIPFGGGSMNPELRTKDNKNLTNYPAPVQLQRIRQDIMTWREALNEAENVWYPHRVKLQKLFIDTVINGHVSACIDRRKDLTLLRKWEFVDRNGKVDQKTTDMFMDTVKGQSQNKEWFNKFLNHGLDSIYFGYSLISLGDVVDGEFPDLDIVKRWNVSPDRMNVTNFTYSISGAKFEDEPYKDWHVYVKTYNDIGTSKSGYGLLYKVANYEIFLRNLIGFNGDFVELFSQPYRVGKTTKKAGDPDYDAMAGAMQQMGSSGWALIDPQDEIEFLETALGGTGYKGYTDFELRLEKKISKIILGHADAIDSVPGKLGNSGEKSPAEKAMEDKQTKDGAFIANVVNNGLLVNMRNLGFAIPEETIAVLKNDAEIMELNNAVIAQAVEMYKAGLTMDNEYFTAQTGIPVTAPPEPIIPTIPKLTESVKNKLEKIYNHVHIH